MLFIPFNVFPIYMVSPFLCFPLSFRLKEINMSEYDADTYERFSKAVRRQVQSLRIILDSLQVSFSWPSGMARTKWFGQGCDTFDRITALPLTWHCLIITYLGENVIFKLIFHFPSFYAGWMNSNESLCITSEKFSPCETALVSLNELGIKILSYSIILLYYTENDNLWKCCTHTVGQV